MNATPRPGPGRPACEAAAVTHPFLQHDGPIVYAHRGGGAEQPENSMAAFTHATSLGLTYLETDARLTADGVLVALHDDHLDRVSDGSGPVGARTAAEVTACRLKAPDGSLSEERIPLLADVLATFPAARFNLDAKDAATVGPLGDLLASTGALDRVCVGAFSDERLKALRRRFGSALCSALGPLEVTRLKASSLGFPVVAGIDGQVVQVPERHRVALPLLGTKVPVPLLDRRLVRRSAKLGLPVHVWTVDDAAEMRRLLAMGCGGFMTDRPSVAAGVLADIGTSGDGTTRP